MKTIVCALCKNNKNSKELYPSSLNNWKLKRNTFSARRTPDGIHYRFLECSKCGLIFSSPILDVKVISKLYGDSGFTYDQESSFLKTTYSQLLKRTLPEKIASVKLLDIGCGNGFFLEKVKELGISDVWGIEPGKASVEKAREDVKKRIKVGLLGKNTFKSHTFDFITCFHTLDHVIDPNNFIQIVHKFLKPGGKIVFVTHDVNGLSVKLLGEKSPIFDIEHIFLFNKTTLARIFQRNGFKNIKVFDVKNTYPISYWIKLFPLPKFVKKIILSGLDLTQLKKIPISLKAGNIAVIAEK